MIREDTRLHLGEDIWNRLYGNDRYYAMLWVSNWVYASRIQQTMDMTEIHIVNEFMWVLIGKTFAVE